MANQRDSLTERSRIEAEVIEDDHIKNQKRIIRDRRANERDR